MNRGSAGLVACALLFWTAAAAQPANDLQAEGLRYWNLAKASTAAPPQIAGCLSPEASRRVVAIGSARTATDQAAWIEAWRAGADAYARQTEVLWRAQADTVSTQPESPADKAAVTTGLLARAQLDETVRNAPSPAGLSPEARAIHDRLLAQAVCRTAETNTKWLKAVVQEFGWPDRKNFSPEADHKAWLLVQHAQNDLTWQRQALILLRGLLDTDATDPANVANLADRVSLSENRPQRFGTQGGCVAPGRWQAEPIENAEEIDDRRAELGLSPSAAYAATLGAGCR